MKLRQAICVGSIAAATAALVTACGSSGSGSQSSGNNSGGGSSGALGVSQSELGGAANYKAMAALYKQAVAKDQTSVVIYGPSAGASQEYYDAFHKAFPKITVKGVPVVGPPMDTKLNAEHTSGKHIGDIAYTGNTGMLKYKKQGYFTPFTPSTAPSADQLIGAAIGPDNAFWGVTETLAGVVTNKNKVDNPPKNWTDLTDSKYKNKLAMYDPTASGQMSDVFAHLTRESKYANLMAGLKANSVQLFPASSITGPLTAVAQGAKDVAVVMSYGFFKEAEEKGAPVRFSLYDSDNYTVILYQGVLKGAPHPLAAQLYVNWMYTPQAQKVMAEKGTYSTVKGAPAPEGLKALDSIPLMKELPIDQAIPANNAAIKAATKYWGG